MRNIGWTSLTVGLGSTIALWHPAPAAACGGTFCDAGPNVMDPDAMPVDQTGETIVFVMDDVHVEAHIQINYDPESGAERFAWLIPIMGESPEFSVGSQRLFLNLQNATVPSYGYVNEREFCGGGGGFDDSDWDGDWDGCGEDGGFGGAAEPGGGGEGDDGETTGGGAEVVSQSTVGAFDVVVLTSETAEELMTWLGDNEFFQDPAAEPIVQEYLDEGALFAAVRLSNAAEVGEIHPITLRYVGTEPCVPIRLTRIAAREDMDIRAFFLADNRVYPSNYRHVELNPLKIDWVDLASNYKDVVTMAIDTPLVDGHGFVTEYAGPTEVVSREGLRGEQWDAAPFSELSALEAPGKLMAQGLLQCSDLGCVDEHPLIGSLLDKYVPVPDGVTRGRFYSCMECYEEQIDQEAWDAEQFALDLRTRVIEPGERAQALLEDNPFVTRLYTTLSPHEMTLDPMFHLAEEPVETAALVDDTAVTATRHFSCSSATRMQDLPGGRAVTMSSFDQWPDISPEQMPWVERVTEHMPGTAPVVLLDHTERIDTLVDAWNTGFRSWSGSHCGDPGITRDEPETLRGCSCRSDSRDGGTGWALLVLALGAGGWSRRRRRASP